MSWRKEMFKSAGTKLVNDIEEKKFGELTSVLHRGNQDSLRLFSKITGSKTGNKEEIKEGIRSLDPDLYDKWEERMEKAEKERIELEKKEEKEAKELDLQKAHGEQGQINLVGNEPDLSPVIIPKNIAYHAGDLGKAEHYGRFYGSNRSTGHFGTGTYFVGKKRSC